MIIDFKMRYQAAFGYVTNSVSRRLAGMGFDVSSDTVSKANFEVYTWDENNKFDEVTIRRSVGGRKEEYAFGALNMLDDNTDMFAMPPMISPKAAKKLIVTSLDGDCLESVERYGTEPYEFTMQGLLIDMHNHQFPLDKLRDINRIFKYNGIWNVDSEILNALDIHAFYIKDVDIGFLEGFEDTISYTLSCRQIQSLEYQLIMS